MTDKPKSTFAGRVRATKPRARKYEVRGDVVTGLGLAVQPSGVRTFVLNRMVHGRRRYATVGNADAITVPQARAEARKLIAAFLDTVKKDRGHRTPGQPMDAFAEEFLDPLRPPLEAPDPAIQQVSSFATTSCPPSVNLTVDAITVAHVKDWFASMADRPGSANRAMPLLSVMMRMAELWGYRPHNSNPCKKTKRYRTEPKELFLTAEEMARLNAVLPRDEFYCPHRPSPSSGLLMLTGCRARRSRLARMGLDSAASASTCPTRSPAREPCGCRASPVRSSTPSRATAPIARSCLSRTPADAATSTTSGINGSRIRDEAGLPGLRLHDLRHSWASVAAMNGVDMVTIAKLLGSRPG